VGDVGDGRSKDRSGGRNARWNLGADAGSARSTGFNRPDAWCPCMLLKVKDPLKALIPALAVLSMAVAIALL
jgi:hypothetical protein